HQTEARNGLRPCARHDRADGIGPDGEALDRRDTIGIRGSDNQQGTLAVDANADAGQRPALPAAPDIRVAAGPRSDDEVSGRRRPERGYAAPDDAPSNERGTRNGADSSHESAGGVHDVLASARQRRAFPFLEELYVVLALVQPGEMGHLSAHRLQ